MASFLTSLKRMMAVQIPNALFVGLLVVALAGMLSSMATYLYLFSRYGPYNDGEHVVLYRMWGDDHVASRAYDDDAQGRGIVETWQFGPVTKRDGLQEDAWFEFGDADQDGVYDTLSHGIGVSRYYWERDMDCDGVVDGCEVKVQGRDGDAEWMYWDVDCDGRFDVVHKTGGPWYLVSYSERAEPEGGIWSIGGPHLR